MPTLDEVLVPPRRLGALLRESRVAAGAELVEIAHRSRQLTAVDLDDLEHGRRVVDDVLLRELVGLYGIEGELVPARSRLVIDLDEGLIAVDSERVPVDSPEVSTDAVLVRYLALILRLRGLPVGSEVKIRDLDIGVLATALRLDGAEVESRLRRLMATPSAVEAPAKALRRRYLVPLAGVVVASTAMGLLVIVSDETRDDGSSRPAPSVVDEVPDIESVTTPAPIPEPPTAPSELPTEIGDAAVVERDPVPTEIGDAVVVESGSETTTRD